MLGVAKMDTGIVIDTEMLENILSIECVQHCKYVPSHHSA